MSTGPHSNDPTFDPRPAGLRSIPVIGVMGSGKDEHRSLAEPLGRRIAESGWHLLTGGGRGVMTSVARAFCSVGGRAGLSIGILPGRLEADGYGTKEGYPNPFVELSIPTHLWAPPGEEAGPESRNHLNVLASYVVVALPGSAGTAAEVGLALQYGRPVIAYLSNRGQISGLAELAVPIARQLDEVERFVRRALAGPAL